MQPPRSLMCCAAGAPCTQLAGKVQALHAALRDVSRRGAALSASYDDALATLQQEAADIMAARQAR